MPSKILIENGPWEPVNEVASFIPKGYGKLDHAVYKINQELRASLRLRQDPLELRKTSGGFEIRARSIAGTVSNGHFSIDVAPKFVAGKNLDKEWSLSLMALVQYALSKHVFLQKNFQINAHRSRFVDLLSMAFIDAVEAGLRDQVIHTYNVVEEAGASLRGRINMQRQIKTYLKRPHFLECDIDQLDSFNKYNDLLKWAADRFCSLVQSPVLTRKLREISIKIPGRNLPLAIHQQKQINLPPQFRAWHLALEIAVLLSSGFSHNQSGGLLSGYSFAFNMEKLFEHFVDFAFKKATLLLDDNFVSKSQLSTPYAFPQLATGKTFYSKPDNVLVKNKTAHLILDAKYKKLSNNEGDKSRKPQNQDVYELVAAMSAHGCDKGLLVYPKILSDSLLDDRKLQVWHISSFGKTLTIGAVAVDLMDLRLPRGLRSIEHRLAEAMKNLL
ncbi:hypothetical protein R5M92_04135 [Halomonas sp. Bachu 37]|uniref:McrC family protein n=1 Tax=Halomonas kashgarensis TaxID=3084920 RepID=UPI003216D889